MSNDREVAAATDGAFDPYRSGLYDYVMGSGVLSCQWRRIHRAMEKPYDRSSYQRVLEAGGGRGEHLAAVRSNVEEYLITDLRADRLPSPEGLVPFARPEQQDVQSLTYPDHHFDRVVVSCLLPHVQDPARALSELHRVTRPGGSVCIYLPCEPGMALRAARRITTIPKNRRFGVTDPYFEHFREHVHYFTALNHFVRREFNNDHVRIRSYPLPYLPWNASLYKIYWITIAGAGSTAES